MSQFDPNAAPTQSDHNAAGTAPPADGMVQCEITGQWFPEDEIVTIQGHRVCAEGKAELLERLRSGELQPGEIERSSGLRRFGAWLVDSILLSVAVMVGTILFFGMAAISGGASPGASPTALGMGYMVYMVVAMAGVLAYYTYLHGRYGQTLGKMAAKIKVVNDDGSPISMGMAFVRILIYQGPAAAAGLITAMGVAMAAEGPVAIGVMASYGANVYVLISAILALIDRDKQLAIHDRLSKTRVITAD